jgi:hypothetical protein
MNYQLKSEMREALIFFDDIFIEKSKKGEEDRGYYACASLALNKSIPQKPIDKSLNKEDWHIMCCPNCNRVFWNSGEFVHYQPHYCENCGQALDWSDT